AGQLPVHSAYRKVTITGLPRKSLIRTRRPSWSRRAKAGARAPGGIAAPANGLAAAVADRSPPRLPAARETTISAAIASATAPHSRPSVEVFIVGAGYPRAGAGLWGADPMDWRAGG